MLKVKNMEMSAEKWTENGSRAAQTYAIEAAASAELWAANTANAADNYKAGISQAGIADRFRAGVRRAGAAKYARKISAVAQDRYGPGIQAAKDDWRMGFEPYHSTLASLTLTPRKPRGDIANYARSQEVGKALNTKRLALLGVSRTGGS